MKTAGQLLGVLEEKPAHCDTHGAYTAYLMKIGTHRWTTCPYCAEALIDQQREAEAQQLANEQQRKRSYAMLSAAGIPPRYQDASFSRYVCDTGDEQEQVKARVAGYAKNAPRRLTDGDSIIMMGKVGNGKTHLACALVRCITTRHHMSARYMTAGDLFMRVRNSYTHREESESDIVQALTAPALLVIDEVGATRANEHDQAILNAVLSARYDQQRSTVICTNLDADDLRAWLGDRITDRMRQTSEVLSFTWESYRGANA